MFFFFAWMFILFFSCIINLDEHNARLCCFCLFLTLFFLGLQGMPGNYISPSGPMGMSMGQPGYPPSQMPLHHTQLRHGPSMHTYIPGHHHHPAMMMHGGPPHPAMPVSASSPSVLNTGDPTMSGHVMDIHAQ